MQRTASFLLPMWLATAWGCLTGAAEPLRVGMELSYPPFEMTDPQGRPAGVSVRLAEALGRHLGRPVRIENIAFDGLIPALKAGHVDCVISSMTATPERAKSIAFSEPYLQTGLALLIAEKSPVTSAADLDAAGRAIAVKQGTTGQQWAVTTLKQARVLVLDTEAAAVLEVIQGRADAFVYDSMSVYINHRKHPTKTRAVLTPFKQESWAVGLKQGNDDLRRQVNEFLDAFRSDGGFDRLGDEFLAEQKAYFRDHGIPFYF
ncbi:MAG: transporter substrate-binding domain-containing protein [Planctomycetaceae bacterium]